MEIKHNNEGVDSTACSAAFECLRQKLASEVTGSAMLADLLGKLNGMQDACARPADFKLRFDEFAARAVDYSDVVAPYLSELVRFLPPATEKPKIAESVTIEGQFVAAFTWEVA
jgi:hypothetical protein